MAYIYLVDEIQPGGVAETVICVDESLDGTVNLDLDSTGHILGIEIDGAKQLLPREVLDRAEAPG